MASLDRHTVTQRHMLQDVTRLEPEGTSVTHTHTPYIIGRACCDAPALPHNPTRSGPARQGRKRGRVVYSLTCCIKLSVETDITLRALLNAINGPSLETGLITRSDLVRDFIEDGVAAAWSRLADGTYDLAASSAFLENNNGEQADGL